MRWPVLCVDFKKAVPKPARFRYSAASGSTLHGVLWAYKHRMAARRTNPAIAILKLTDLEKFALHRGRRSKSGEGLNL